jgi:hypothetical protein
MLKPVHELQGSHGNDRSYALPNNGHEDNRGRGNIGCTGENRLKHNLR